MSVKLGDKVKDRISGYVGIVVARHIYLNGCDRISVQPAIDKDGKLPDPESFDEMQLEVTREEVVKEEREKDTGGPEKYPDVRRY